MIAKQYRLKESQIGKVLRYKKPFFSNILIANVSQNRLEYPRFALILSGKVTKTSVDRNFYRRLSYDICREYFSKISGDIVLVAKKGTILSRKDPQMVLKFRQELHLLLHKIK